MIPPYNSASLKLSEPSIDVLAPELAKLELGLVAEEERKKEQKEMKNMKVKFEALTSSSVLLDDYSTSDSSDYSQGSTKAIYRLYYIVQLNRLMKSRRRMCVGDKLHLM